MAEWGAACVQVVVTLQPGDLRGLNERVAQFIQDITACEAEQAQACRNAESRWADSIHTIVMVAFVRGLEAALAEREAHHQQLVCIAWQFAKGAEAAASITSCVCPDEGRGWKVELKLMWQAFFWRAS